jgi:MOSC domain-containing protein YiiM
MDRGVPTGLAAMMARHARPGQVAWIGLRPVRRGPVVEVREAAVGAEGLEGDHGRAGKRAVTLLQAEHVDVIAALLGRAAAPLDLRRNVVVDGINLASLRHGEISIGDALLRIEGPCPPCSRMEEALGYGGYSAVRGHGGWYASVVAGGRIAVGDAVAAAGPFGVAGR